MAYAKVRRGWALEYLGFFVPGSEDETRVANEVAITLNRYQNAVASVSVECSDALWGVPVIGDFPRFGSPEATKPIKPTPFTDVQRTLLTSMLDGEPRRLIYKQILSGRALLGKGYAAHVEGKPESEWWIRITDAGRVKLAELSAAGQVY